MAKKTPAKAETNTAFVYSEAMEQLGGLMARLQDESTPLEESYELFKQCSTLIAQCRQYLDSTDLKVKQLIDGMEQDFE